MPGVAGARANAVVHGSPQTIADMMEEWFRKDGCDGFNIMPPLRQDGAAAAAARRSGGRM